MFDRELIIARVICVAALFGSLSIISVGAPDNRPRFGSKGCSDVQQAGAVAMPMDVSSPAAEKRSMEEGWKQLHRMCR